MLAFSNIKLKLMVASEGNLGFAKRNKQHGKNTTDCSGICRKRGF